jgi:hypothetical protein
MVIFCAPISISISIVCPPVLSEIRGVGLQLYDCGLDNVNQQFQWIAPPAPVPPVTTTNNVFGIKWTGGGNNLVVDIPNGQNQNGVRPQVSRSRSTSQNQTESESDGSRSVAQWTGAPSC